MAGTVEWGQVPPAVQQAVARRTGPVDSASPGGQGVSTDLRLILRTASGSVFVKGTGPDADELRRERLHLGAALAPFVPALSPPLLFQVQADGWDVTGWPALPGRPADLRPGSADIPKLTRLLAELGTIQAPGTVPMRSVAECWATPDDEPGSLDGGHLVHTDPHGGNFIVDGDRVRLLDWGWAMRGPAWVTPVRFILFLMEAGWEPGDAERAVARLPAWAETPPGVITADAVSGVGSWETAAARRPDNEGLRRWLGLARAWAGYRAAQGRRSVTG